MNRILSHGTTNGITFEHIARDGNFNMATKHFHDEFELYYLCEGSRYYFIGNQTHLIEKGSLVLINQHQIHKTSPTDSQYHDRILIEFQPSSMSSLSLIENNFDLNNFFSEHEGVIKLREQEQKVVTDYFQDIFHEHERQHPHYESMIQLKLNELFLYLARILPTHPKQNQTSPHSPKHQKVNSISDYIATHYGKALTLEELANTFFLNKSYLSRIFKEITGFTVNEYIYIVKIKKAKELLISTNWRISEISNHLGYSSLTYFERVFKKYTETTPLRYRKNMLQNKHQIRDRLNTLN